MLCLASDLVGLVGAYYGRRFQVAHRFVWLERSCHFSLSVPYLHANDECRYIGDVEKLLKEHRENQDLVRSIGASHYQIVFPVQLRHREKMGISTREIGATKVNSIDSLFFNPLMYRYMISLEMFEFFGICTLCAHLYDSQTIISNLITLTN